MSTPKLDASAVLETDCSVRTFEHGDLQSTRRDLAATTHHCSTSGMERTELLDSEIEVKRLVKELELLRKEATRLAAEVVELQAGHRIFRDTREFLLRALDKERRKRTGLQRTMSWQLTRPLRLVAGLLRRRNARKAKAAELPPTIFSPSAPQLDNIAPVDPATARDPALLDQASVAVVIHAFYPELLPDLLNRLLAANFRFDLFVTCREDAAETIRGYLREAGVAEGYVEVVPNRGRDIAPFLRMLPLVQSRGYSILLKLHTSGPTIVSMGTCGVRPCLRLANCKRGPSRHSRTERTDRIRHCRAE